MDKELITVGKLAKLLNIRPTTLQYWLIRGILPFSETKIDGRGVHRLFSKTDVELIRKFNEERKLVKAKYNLQKLGDE